VKKATLLFILILLAGYVSAINIRQSLENADDLSVGDRFQLVIYADAALKSVVIPDTITNFHVYKVERKTKGKEYPWISVTLVPLLPGSHVFPSIKVIPEETDGIDHYTDRFRVYIVPVRAEKDTLLVDIKPVEKYPLQIPLWVYLVLIAVLAVLIVLFIILSRKPKTEKAEAAPVEIAKQQVPDPAWRIALNQLDALIRLELVRRGDHIRHHYELSLILRHFLERKYRFTAGEMTTTEILWVTQRVWIERSAEVVEFLRFCDKVKFAKYLPSPDEIENAERWLRTWLQYFEVLEAHQRIGGGEHGV
jgi:hypothetical protein